MGNTQAPIPTRLLQQPVFGDAAEPHHAEARAIAGRTEEALAAVVAKTTKRSASEAGRLAQVVSAILMVAMASAADASVTVDEIVATIEAQLEVVLPH